MEPQRTSRIEVPWPASGPLHLRVSLGACRLRISPGEGAGWVEGSCEDASGALPWMVSQEAGAVRLSQEYRVRDAIGLFRGVPGYDLRLGKARPYALTLETGASDSVIELGGIPLQRLTLKHGAGRLTCRFSAPNPEEMALLEVEGGAAGIDLAGLGHAGLVQMTVSGGAAACDLDFSGALRRDARVRITTGASAVRLRVPATTAARIAVASFIGSVEVGDGFMKKQGAFWSEAAVAGGSPVLTVEAEVALGSLSFEAG